MFLLRGPFRFGAGWFAKALDPGCVCVAHDYRSRPTPARMGWNVLADGTDYSVQVTKRRLCWWIAHTDAHAANPNRPLYCRHRRLFLVLAYNPERAILVCRRRCNPFGVGCFATACACARPRYARGLELCFVSLPSPGI